MEPNKTYKLHSDDASQSARSTNAADDAQNNQPQASPSSTSQPESTPVKPAAPWYLQPLTKTTAGSKLANAQRWPFSLPASSSRPVEQPKPQTSPSQPQPATNPQQPLRPAEQAQQIVQAPPMSPFRSQPLPPPMPRQTAPAVNQAQPMIEAQYQQPPRQPLRSPYQHSTPTGNPKPFSQFNMPAQGVPAATQVQTQPSKPAKSRRLIFIIAGLLLLASLATGGYLLWRNTSSQPNTPMPVANSANAQDRLYNAIENHFQTKTIRQVYEQSADGASASTVKLDTLNDFSDSRQPKSNIKYELKSGEGDKAVAGAGELIIEGGEQYYGKLTKPVLFYEGDDAFKPKENQWYAISPQDATGEMLIDPLSARSSINTSLGEIPVGNFDKSTRDELMKFIKDRDLYKVKTDKEVRVDGKKMTQYSVDFNVDLINELNAKVYAALGGDINQEVPIEFTNEGIRQTEIWVDHESSRIVRIKIERESQASGSEQVIKESTNLTISYPNDVADIKKPEGAIEGPWVTTRQ